MIERVEHATLGTVRVLGIRSSCPTRPARCARAPPTLGQHTESMLRNDLGFSAAEIAAMRSRAARSDGGIPSALDERTDFGDEELEDVFFGHSDRRPVAHRALGRERAPAAPAAGAAHDRRRILRAVECQLEVVLGVALDDNRTDSAGVETLKRSPSPVRATATSRNVGTARRSRKSA